MATRVREEMANPILGYGGADQSTRCPGCFSSTDAGRTCSRCEHDAQVRRSSLAVPQGTLLADQFLIGRVLGSGGFGITYLAWDTRLETQVAIKEYFAREFAMRRADRTGVTPSFPDHAELFHQGLQGFLREARTLARFDHPHIVRVRTYFEANGTGYLVMNYYDGLSLQAFMDQHGKPVPEKQALAIMLPVLDGLQVVHDRGLLHRDIKPSNIYLADRLGPVLLDFGTARVAAGERSRSLTVILTRGFAPLEQYSRRGNQGPWTDIYACAASLYYLVTGAVPPDANERLRADPCVALQALDARLSASFCAAVERALAVRPEERPQQVRDFTAELLGPAPLWTGDMVVCVRCGTKNRVPSDRVATAACCGRCNQRLLGKAKSSSADVVRCGNCDVRNRVRTEHGARGQGNGRARCGKCGDVL